MMGYGYGTGGGWIATTVFWVGLLVLVVWILARAVRVGGGWGVAPPRDRHPDSAGDILDRRLAAGELDEETYRSMLAVLRSSSSHPDRAPVVGTAKRHWAPLVALLAVLGSGFVLADRDGDPGPGFGPWGGPGMPMMGGSAGSGWLAGDGDRVDDLSEARDRAEWFAAALGPELRVGEVMRFANHYYAEIEEPDGTKATEVLVDPSSGAVQLEFGPAMMWNTRFGMMARPGATAELSAEQAHDAAQEWADDRDGLTVAEPEAFPGYYTLHTLRDGRIEGMLSVHAVTGAVWFHSWHGEFQELSEGE